MIMLGNAHKVKISIDIPSDEGSDFITFIFPARNDARFVVQQREFLKGRWRMGGSGTPINVSTEARVHFFDHSVESVEGPLFVQSGEESIPMGPGISQEILAENGAEKWTDLIPIHWKLQVAGEFEESAVKIKKKIDSD